MDAVTIALIAFGVLAALAVFYVGYRMDRRNHHIQSAAWMRNWAIRNRALADLFRRWKGPLRLQDQRAAPPPETGKRAGPKIRKTATRRRKRTTGPSR